MYTYRGGQTACRKRGSVCQALSRAANCLEMAAALGRLIAVAATTTTTTTTHNDNNNHHQNHHHHHYNHNNKTSNTNSDSNHSTADGNNGVQTSLSADA